MTDPSGVPTSQEPSSSSSSSSDSGKKYIVKTPWHINTLKGNDDFPDLTNKGVEMSGAEKDAAKKAAKAHRIKLLVKEV